MSRQFPQFDNANIFLRKPYGKILLLLLQSLSLNLSRGIFLVTNLVACFSLFIIGHLKNIFGHMDLDYKMRCAVLIKLSHAWPFVTPCI